MAVMRPPSRGLPLQPEPTGRKVGLKVQREETQLLETPTKQIEPNVELGGQK